MKKRNRKWISVLLTALLAAGMMTSIPSAAYAKDNDALITKVDVDDIGKGTVVEHTHIYQTYYDEYYHWSECIVCGDKKDIDKHTLEGNGGSKVLFSDYYSESYRDTCKCGYESGPQVVLLGTHENYPNGKDSRITYSPLTGMKLSEIKEITEAEYNALLLSFSAISPLYITFR